MTAFLYWPYDEVMLDSPGEDNVVHIKSPWLTAKVKFKAEDRDRIENLAEKFSSQSLSATDIPLINWFFTELDHYPLCYIIPAPKAHETDAHDIRDPSLLNLPFAEFLRSIISQSNYLNKDESAKIAADFEQKDWSWDAEAALGFAQHQGKIHPESLFTVVRRFHLLDVLEKDQGKETFKFIESLDGENFARAAAILVRQNHFVTQKCQEALLPANQIAGRARGQVEDFVKAENGHDLILNVALKALHPHPESLPVSLHTKALMSLLQFAAERNFLAFAMAVDFFERSSYEKIDPMAQLLLKGGFEKAAKQINRHMEINDAGGHENVACSFLEPMAPCSPDYALEALRIAETVSLLMNNITASALELFHASEQQAPKGFH
jgi:hypothetical protein